MGACSSAEAEQTKQQQLMQDIDRISRENATPACSAPPPASVQPPQPPLANDQAAAQSCADARTTLVPSFAVPEGRAPTAQTAPRSATAAAPLTGALIAQAASAWWAQRSPDQEVTVRRDGKDCSVPQHALSVGDVVVLRAGDAIPTDCRLEKGSCSVDLQAVTGYPGAMDRSPQGGEDWQESWEPSRVFEGENLLPHGGTLVQVFKPDTHVEATVIAAAANSQLATICAQAESTHADYRALDEQALTASQLQVIDALVAQASELGLRIRTRSTFLLAGQVSAVVFDKTGVLSLESLGVAQVVYGDTIKETGFPTIRCIEPSENYLVFPRALIRAAGLLSDGSSSTDNAIRSFAKAAVSIVFEEEIQPYQASHAARVVLPFDGRHKLTASMIENDGGLVLVKGAAERVMERCTTIQLATSGPAVALTTEIREELDQAVTRLGENALRVLALAEKPHTSKAEFSADDMQELTFLGLVGLIAPLAPGTRDAVQRLQALQLKIAVVSGDHATTVKAITSQAGIGAPGEENEVVAWGVSESEMPNFAARECPVGGYSDAASGAIPETLCVGRFSPSQKLKLVSALKEQGHRVCAVGDGFDDSSMLAEADLGVALSSGSPVTKSTSSCVVTSDLRALANLLESAKHHRDDFKLFEASTELKENAMSA